MNGSVQEKKSESDHAFQGRGKVGHFENLVCWFYCKSTSHPRATPNLGNLSEKIGKRRKKHVLKG